MGTPDGTETGTVTASVSDSPQPHSNRLLHASIALFVLGLIALLVLMTYPAMADGHRAPGVIGGLTLCAPIGLLLALVFALLSGRRVRKAAEPRP
ncbi:hypothetical protein [Jongsikchunia kroppenstedtii]|uniref:hypothetical protein n=1 Tax=Jongsikchunia kroppenstedtii TaxID=1121721 RepID=UPI00036E235A|nr:hypothetical protein [Jongsikchunia kroppenstedtii]